MKPGKISKKSYQKLANGSMVLTPEQAKMYGGLGSSVSDAGSGILTMGAANTMNNNVANKYGEIDVKDAGKAGAMSGAAAGLKMGATVGLNPAVLAATGGLSALAPVVGAGIGTIIGNRTAKKNAAKNNAANREAYETAQAEKLAAEEKAKKDAFYNSNFRSGLESAFTQRQAGYKDGGEVEGPGTAKSDDVKAKIKPRSFIVPAENADVAKEIRSKVLKAPNIKKKANLNQSGGADVKLSNGEHVFTPEEKEILLSKGIDLTKLAPNAKIEIETYMRNGGDVRKYKDGTTLEGVEPSKSNDIDLEKEKKKI